MSTTVYREQDNDFSRQIKEIVLSNSYGFVTTEYIEIAKFCLEEFAEFLGEHIPGLTFKIKTKEKLIDLGIEKEISLHIKTKFWKIIPYYKKVLWIEHAVVRTNPKTMFIGYIRKNPNCPNKEDSGFCRIVEFNNLNQQIKSHLLNVLNYDEAVINRFLVKYINQKKS